MRTPAELTVAFRSQGLKLTPQRQLLFALLHDHEGHPTADSLFAEATARMPGISLRTVYQTLTDLTSMGELRTLHVDGGPTRFDPNTTDHHHASCVSCGSLRDIDLDLPSTPVDGFRVERAHVVITGVCASCAS